MWQFIVVFIIVSYIINRSNSLKNLSNLEIKKSFLETRFKYLEGAIENDIFGYKEIHRVQVDPPNKYDNKWVVYALREKKDWLFGTKTTTKISRVFSVSDNLLEELDEYKNSLGK